jgi:hypothetical protein
MFYIAPHGCSIYSTFYSQQPPSNALFQRPIGEGFAFVNFLHIKVGCPGFP